MRLRFLNIIINTPLQSYNVRLLDTITIIIIVKCIGLLGYDLISIIIILDFGNIVLVRLKLLKVGIHHTIVSIY